MRRLVLLPCIALLVGMPVQADVATRSADGLGTRINGALGGRCSSGVCHIDGGTRSGSNRFHRLSEFDTRGAIEGVSINSHGVRNLVLGVTAADGSFINKAVSLTSPAHLFLLSPGGIQLMPGASFQQIPQLTLSTASQLHFAGGVFDVFNTPHHAISALVGDPLPGSLGLLPGSLGEKRPWIRMDGVSLDVDEALLVDAPGGRIDLDNSRLSVSNSSGDAGSLTLSADLIKVSGGSELLATGSGDGGLVQVGGSWQNTDPRVRQATQTWMQQGSTVDVSSTGSGDGGTIVIWSDLSHPSGGTIAQGALLARGGPEGGDGGRIETSGPYLIAMPESLDLSAPRGQGGDWLLDPFNLTIFPDTSNPGGTNFSATGNDSLWTSISDDAGVRVGDIKSQLTNGSNVRLLTGQGTTDQGGNIVWQAGADLDFSRNAITNAVTTTNLTLDASGYIQLNSNITTGSGGLTLKADAGFAEAAEGLTINLSGPLEIGTGDSRIGTDGFGSPSFAATLIGDGNLIKNGNGRLILSGNNANWNGTAFVEAGSLRVTSANALGSSTSSTTVQSAGTLEVSGGITIAEPVILSEGKLISLDGDNTLTATLELLGSSSVEVLQDTFTLDPTSGKAVIVNSGRDAFNSDLTYSGAGDFVVKGSLNLQDGQSTKTYGDFRQTGAGTARLQDSFFAERAEITAGGVLWLDQPVYGDIEVTTLFLDNGALLRRDVSETVVGANLELGSGGGGISVADGFTLVWDSAISGSGDFIKEGDGILRFPSTANISYTGETLVKAGKLNVFSTSPTNATCSGNGSSNRCARTDSSSASSETDTRMVVLLNAIDDVPEFPPVQQNELTAETGAASGSGGVSRTQSQSNKSLAVDLADGAEVDVAVSTSDTSVAAATTQTLSADQAVDQLSSSDQAATTRTAQALGLDQGDQDLLPPTPTLDELRAGLEQVETQRFAPSPAVLQVRFTAIPQAQPGTQDAFLDLTLISARSPVQAKRVEVNRNSFSGLLKALYRQLSRQEPMAVDNPASPTRQLHALLVEPLEEILEAQGIETLLIAADQGLQAVPFAALSDGSEYFGNRYAFALTPSLALTPIAPSESFSKEQLAMGASTFDGLAPLPLVPQELERLAASSGSNPYLNQEFTPRTLLERSADQRYARLHVATHADFRPGGPTESVLHTGIGPMSMAKFADLRRARRDQPLDLVVLSACRTLLGDADSELGFAGLALQAGARSAIGTLWYVDDVVTSAFFVQFYRLLDQGLSKAQALQQTRQLFSSGMIRLDGDSVIGPAGQPLLNELNSSQRRRIAAGIENPFFWAGIELIGSPW